MPWAARRASEPGESVAGVFATAGAGFVDANLGQLRHQRLDLVPDPLGDHFAGGVFQPGDVVQVVVVQLIIDRLEDRLDLGEVADPARVRVERAGQVQADLERVAMQTAAFVPFRDVGQAVGRFECEFLENFHWWTCISWWDKGLGRNWSFSGLLNVLIGRRWRQAAELRVS